MLAEVRRPRPQFGARLGAVLAGQGFCRRLAPGSYRNLMVTIVPGERGEYLLYEDDGVSQDYLKGACAWIKISHKKEMDR